jgi:hypothetical protein
MPKFSELLFGKKPKLKQQELYSPQQKQLMGQITQGVQPLNTQALQYLMSLLSSDPEVMQEYEAPLMEQFESQIIPSILQRFASSGTNVQPGKSGSLNLALAQAARGFGRDLASQRAGLRQNAISQLQGFNQIGLNQLTQPYTTGGMPGALGSLGAIGGSVLGGITSNPAFRGFRLPGF